MYNKIKTLTACTVISCAGFTQIQALTFDDDVTPDVIFGSGNANGSFTVDRNAGVELGLRGKLRHDATGQPQNVFNSNGDGTYSFNPGVAPTQAFPTAEWSIEWSINTDHDDTSGLVLSDLTYKLGFDSDPTLGTSFAQFDPIHDVNPGNGRVQWDHAIGNNSTANGGGTSIPNGNDDEPGYAALIDANNVAQNSWKAHWVIVPFDPTVDGVYDVILIACDSNDDPIAATSIQVLVGDDDDGDGVPNGVDPCPDSDISPTVVIDGNDTGVDNIDSGNGCTLADLLNDCASSAKNHGQYVSCVAKLTQDLVKDGIITKQDRKAILNAAAKADLP